MINQLESPHDRRNRLIRDEYEKVWFELHNYIVPICKITWKSRLKSKAWKLSKKLFNYGNETNPFRRTR
jgi:hypothetical protein